MDLIGNLSTLAGLWTEAHRTAGQCRVTKKTLGARVLEDAKLFERLEGGRPISVPRFEKLVDYLADPVNWPGDGIPADAERLLAAMGVPPPGWRLVLERDTIERVAV